MHDPFERKGALKAGVGELKQKISGRYVQINELWL